VVYDARFSFSTSLMSNKSEKSTRSGPGFSARLTVFLGSMNLAITLLVALMIASIIGTVLQQNQGYASYILKFGPFWHEVFLSLGLYDVYIAGWFLFLLVFLMLSTAVCVLRNAPLMLRDMRHFRLNVQLKSLRAFHNKHEVRVDLPTDEVMQHAAAMLGAEGFRLRSVKADDHTMLVGMRGGLNRMGYLFAHVGIIVILVGGTLDSKIPLRVGQIMGTVAPEFRDIPANEVPDISRLPDGNPSFRGNVDIPEGRTANIVFLGMDDGYLVQSLPFEIAVKDFRVEHYKTGQPKSFESDLVLTDSKTGESIEQTIAVNHPLVYQDFAIYQASFGDGGSRLKLNLWSLYPGVEKPFSFTGAVKQSYPIESQVYGPLKLEITDFRLFNIEPVVDADGNTEQRNIGPSYTFKLRNEEGVAKEYINYMNPLQQQGRYFFISGVRNTPNEEFRFLNIPQDSDGGVKQFMTYLAFLNDAMTIEKVAEQATQIAVESAGIEDEKIGEQLRKTMARLLTLFAEGGYDAVLSDVTENLPADKQEQAAEAFLNVLHSGTQAMYLEMLGEQGVTEITEQDWQFYDDAVVAIGSLPFYGSPYYLGLESFEHIQSTGLQVTRSPGKDVVYLGSFMLILGVFMMFYIAHQRYWVRIEPEGEGSRVLFAGTSNRNQLDFAREYTRLQEALFGSMNKSA
jgi:cytochrome c biogenesis protein